MNCKLHDACWVSIDPANKSGIAFWRYDRLTGTAVMRAVGKSGKWRVGERAYESRHAATLSVIHGASMVIAEEGFGRFASAIKSQAGMIGYWRCACDALDIPFATVNVSEWRRVIKEAYAISWPATTERKKALSVSLVKKAYGITVTDDEADAVLLGHAAIRMGLTERATIQ